MCCCGNIAEDKTWYLLKKQDHSLQNSVEALPTSATSRSSRRKKKREKHSQTRIYVKSYWLFGQYGVECIVCECVGLTAFAVHVSVTLPVQYSVFVSDSIQQNGNSNKRVAAIGYPRHTLAPTLTLLLHQLRQTLPQLLLLTANRRQLNKTHNVT